MLLSLVNNLRGRPGHPLAMGFFTLTMGYTFYLAPKIENPILRYCCAGTAATLIVEVLTHGIDTINMRSKLINGKKIYVL
jgi:hypothetical protein